MLWEHENYNIVLVKYRNLGYKTSMFVIDTLYVCIV